MARGKTRAKKRSAFDELSAEHRKFVQEYIKTLDPTVSAQRAKIGKGTPDDSARIGQRLLGAELIRAAIQDTRDRLAADTGIAPERLIRDGIVFSETMEAGTRRARVDSQTIVDRYVRRGLITAREHAGAERLSACRFEAGFGHSKISGYGERMAKSTGINDAMSKAYVEFGKAVDALKPDLWPIVNHVVCHDLPVESWSEGGIPRQARMSLLRVSLDVLADHYRLAKEDDSGNPIEVPRRIRAVRA